MTARRELHLLAWTFAAFVFALAFVARCGAEEPVTETGASGWFCGERTMRSAGPAIDEAGACAFGQVGFGRSGVGAYMHTSNTTSIQALSPNTIRVLEMGVEVHWYAAQTRGIAIGPTAWIGGMYGYSTDNVPLVKQALVTWGVGAHIGGLGSWAQLGFGDSEAVGPRAIQILSHVQTSDHTAVGMHLERSLLHENWRIGLRACAGWGKK